MSGRRKGQRHAGRGSAVAPRGASPRRGDGGELHEWAGGFHAVTAILRSAPERVIRLIRLGGRDDQRIIELEQLAREHAVPIDTMMREEMDALDPQLRHQGVLAEFRARRAQRESELLPWLETRAKPWLILALDGIQDPHNLGACLRSADAAGVDAVLIPLDRAAGLGAAARKAAAGAAETVPLFEVTNLSRTLASLQQAGAWVYGAAGEAEQLLWSVDLTASVVLVMGAEGDGLRRLTRAHCDELFRLPMAGQVESLNVSVATGVALFEVVRQRSP